MPRRRLAFAASPGQSRATINAAWRRLLPVPGGRRWWQARPSRFRPGRAVPDDPAVPIRRARHDPARAFRPPVISACPVV